MNNYNDSNINYSERLHKNKIYTAHSKLITVGEYTMDMKDWSRYIGGGDCNISHLIKRNGLESVIKYIEYVMRARGDI